MSQSSHNFGFLESHDPTLAKLATLAEKYFADDPNTALVKLRQFGELLAQQVAAYAGQFGSREEKQAELLGRLKYRGVLTPRAADLFHTLRKVGNVATHDVGAGSHSDALQALKIAREAAIWVHRSYGRAAKFNPGPFVPPRPPENPVQSLAKDLAELRAELEKAKATAAEAKVAAEEQAELAASAKARAKHHGRYRPAQSDHSSLQERGGAQGSGHRQPTQLRIQPLALLTGRLQLSTLMCNSGCNALRGLTGARKVILMPEIHFVGPFP